ncbi:MAG: hypothetical protein ABEI99_07010 [Halobaculum sp.]
MPGSECHIPEWAELLDTSVPDGVCEQSRGRVESEFTDSAQ